MVDRIGDGALAREAILAAMKAQAANTARIGAAADQIAGTNAQATPEIDFASKLKQGLSEVNADIRLAESLPKDLVTGKIDDFHEVAIQLKRADLSFRFALEIRNKLIDAYREVMRMNV